MSTLSAAEFGGEYDRRGICFTGFQWLVSHWCMVKHFMHALAIKIFQKNKQPLRVILWNLGRDASHVSTTFFDRFSRFTHQAKYGAAGWRALDINYNYYEKIEPQLVHFWERQITRHYVKKAENSQAVRNRLKIVVNLLAEEFDRFEHEPEIRLVSLASGSAQAVLEAMVKRPGLPIKAVLIEPDKSAMEQARLNAKSAGMFDRFTFIRGTTKKLEKVCAEFKPHIIEMVGLLDYLDKPTAIDLIRRIREQLPPGGSFLTCNIRKNREKIFLDWVILWPMIYRSKKEFAELFPAAGFGAGSVRIVYEPFEIHGIAVCKKEC